MRLLFSTLFSDVPVSTAEIIANAMIGNTKYIAEAPQRVGYTNSGAMETAMRRETGNTLRQIREENQN